MTSQEALSRPFVQTPDALRSLLDLGIVAPAVPVRLHLGCGEVHLDGYVNIDYPPNQHSVQQRLACDAFGEITALRFPPATVDEVRLHHVFEHFDRPTALALLCHWHRWLKSRGLLVIETPDLQASMWLLLVPWRRYVHKQAILRHLFGSQEAPWATHQDGWYAAKFRHVLSALGFDSLKFGFSRWKMTRNVTVRAQKTGTFDLPTLRTAAVQLLRESLIDDAPSELRMWDAWQARLDEQLAGLQ